MTSKPKHIVAYTFLTSERRMPFVYDEPWNEGEERTFHGRIELGRSGYFFGVTPWDALAYAPGPIVARILVRDPYELRDGKGVAGRVKLLLEADATQVLRYFAHECALQAYRRASRTKCHPDVRLREVLDVILGHVDGRVSDDELLSAWRIAEEIAFDIAGKTMAKNFPERLDYAAAWAAAEAVRAAASRTPWEAAWSAAWSASWAAGYAAAANVDDSEERRDAALEKARDTTTSLLSSILEHWMESLLRSRENEILGNGEAQDIDESTELLSIYEISVLLGKSHDRVEELLVLGQIPGLVRRGKKMYAKKAAIEQFLEEKIDIQQIRNERRLLTTSEVGYLLGRTRYWVRDHAERGEIPGMRRFGRRILFCRAAIEQFIGRKIDIAEIGSESTEDEED